MRRRLASLSIALYVLGVAIAVPVLVRQRFAPDAWWPVALAAEALLYLVPMALWFASIKPAIRMTRAMRMRRMLLAGALLIALAFLAFTLPVAFLIFTGDSSSPFRSLVYLGIWFCVMLFWRRRPRSGSVEAFGERKA